MLIVSPYPAFCAKCVAVVVPSFSLCFCLTPTNQLCSVRTLEYPFFCWTFFRSALLACNCCHYCPRDFLFLFLRSCLNGNLSLTLPAHGPRTASGVQFETLNLGFFCLHTRPLHVHQAPLLTLLTITAFVEICGLLESGHRPAPHQKRSIVNAVIISFASCKFDSSTIGCFTAAL